MEVAVGMGAAEEMEASNMTLHMNPIAFEFLRAGIVLLGCAFILGGIYVAIKGTQLLIRKARK
jgi:hypothetical protein